ncbi:MAG: GxGYxYP family putative glycoside hydrolase, partial [Planctomycetota bacterium]|nr:GxGYxYP family putative glycoside hydrolase [Planctomycetota bacterium]
MDVPLESTVQALGFSKLLDVRGLNDQWVVNNYRDMFIDNAIICHDSTSIPLRDWGPAIKAMTIYSSDYSFTSSVYDSIIDNSPCFGWTDPSAGGELGTVQYHSQKSLYTSSSGLLWNLSTHAGMSTFEPAIEIKQKIRGKQYTPEDNVHYVAFLLSDGGNVRLMFNYSQYATDADWFGSAHRGTFPMGWGIPPSMVKYGPHVMKWYYDNATDLDSFTAYSTGMGYMYPSEFPALDAF